MWMDVLSDRPKTDRVVTFGLPKLVRKFATRKLTSAEFLP